MDNSHDSNEPVAWYVERQHVGFRDHGLKYGPFWKLSEAEEWADCCHILKPLYTTQPKAQPEQEPVAIKWTLDGDKTCGYNNWLGKTPFGRILITWKGWKKYHDACVDEFPGDFHAYGLPDEVKELCEAEFAKRIGYTTSPQRKPLTDEELRVIENKINPNMRWRSSDEEGITLYPIEYYELVRAIETAHGIKE